MTCVPGIQRDDTLKGIKRCPRERIKKYLRDLEGYENTIKCLGSLQYLLGPAVPCTKDSQSTCIVHVHIRLNRTKSHHPTSGEKVPVQSGRTICHSLPSAKKRPATVPLEYRGKEKHQKTSTLTSPNQLRNTMSQFLTRLHDILCAAALLQEHQSLRHALGHNIRPEDGTTGPRAFHEPCVEQVD